MVRWLEGSEEKREKTGRLRWRGRKAEREEKGRGRGRWGEEEERYFHLILS